MTAVTMSSVEWGALVGVMALLIGSLSYLIKREIKHKDDMRKDIKQLDERLLSAIDKMTEATYQLTTTIAEFRLFVTANYVTSDEHDSDILEVKQSINGWAQRFEHQLERHETTCPGKNR